MILLAIIGIIIVLLATVKYPILSFVGFMSTSLFKGYLTANFSFFQQFDLTVLATLYAMFGMTVSVIKHPQDFRKLFNGPYFMMVLLGGLLFLGMTYTSSPVYGWAKCSRWFVFGSIMYLAPLLFLRTVSDIRLLLWIFIVSGFLIGIATLFNVRDGQERASFLESDDIGTAVKISLGALVSFCLIINKNSSPKIRVINGIVLFMCFPGLIMTGSRGPLFGLVICCAISPFLFGRRVSLAWLIPGLVIGILGFGYSMTKAERVASSSFRRITSVWQQEGGVEESFGSRMPLFAYAISHIPRAPVLGHGTGSFAVDFSGVDERKYPHNIFLELGYENGVMGVVLFTIFLFMIYKRWKESRIGAHHSGNEELYGMSSTAGLVFIYFFMQALKSGDLDGNQFLFFCAGFIVSIHYVTMDHLQMMAWNSYDTDGLDE